MASTTPSDFAVLLRGLRRARGLTQEELAARARMSVTAVSYLERGLTRRPRKDTVTLLVRALGLTAEEEDALAGAARRSWAIGDGGPGGVGLESSPGDAHVPTSARLQLIPLTNLLGREHEEAAIVHLLTREAVRLLTLTGPAGVGKTRLAVRVANTLRERHGFDVFPIDLVSVQDAERVLPVLARELSARTAATDGLSEAVARALDGRTALLLLDNFEQILPAASALVDLLGRAKRVKILVTSRAPLNVRGEREVPVRPLALPGAGDPLGPEGLEQYSALALFLERARAVRPELAIATPEDAAIVGEICEVLDGLPLAIELAAARMRLFGLRELRDRLLGGAALSVLAGGAQDLARHQRTMRSAIAWSYDLLGAADRRLFRWLGVFVGGVALRAMTAICGLTEDEAIERLAAQVDASVLRATRGAENEESGRYAQLVVVSAYARERLRVEGDGDEARRCHAAHFLGLLDRIGPWDVNQSEADMAQIDTEYENVRAALAWALETGGVTLSPRVVGAFWCFVLSHSQYLDGLSLLERYIAGVGAPASTEEREALAEAWTGVLAITHRLDRLERAREAGERALALRREVGDQARIADALMNLANPLTAVRDYARATAFYEEALAIQAATNNRAGMVLPLMNLGSLLRDLGRPREALARLEESLAISREVGGSDWFRALTWNGVGETYLLLDEPERAVAVTEPNYQLFKRQRDVFGAAMCAWTLGRAEWRKGAAERARAYLDEAEREFRALGAQVTAARVLYFRACLALEWDDLGAARRDLARALEDSAGDTYEIPRVWWLVERAGTLACRQRDLERAARLYAAGIAARDTMPGPLEPAERELRERDLESLRAALGEDAWARAEAEGRAWSLDDAIVHMRAVLG